MNLKDFKRIECVCLDKRRNEWKFLENQFKERDADITRFIVGKGDVFPPDYYNQIDDKELPTNNVWGNQFSKNAYFCHLAHRKIIESAKKDNLKNILLLEDDCKLTENFDDVLSKSIEQIKSLNIKWDMLYYGSNHVWGITETISENLLKLKGGSYCWHAVAINQEYNDMFQHLLEFPITGPFDWLTAMHTHTNSNFNCYAIWPTIAIQKPGMSYVVGSIQDYTGWFNTKGKQ